MICKEFEELTPIEKSNYIGSLVHVCINSSKMYQLGKELIDLGIISGLFDKVIINPTEFKENEHE